MIGLSEEHLNKLIDNAQKYHHKKKSEIAGHRPRYANKQKLD
ncbi:hypothetical protein [Moorena sp. SIO3I8]|nr:hypothetical protein [Moorena sp. SIO3I8]